MKLSKALITPRGNSDTAKFEILRNEMPAWRQAINTPLAEFAKAALLAAGVYAGSSTMGASPEDSALLAKVAGGLWGAGMGGIKLIDNLISSPKTKTTPKKKDRETDPEILDDIDW